MPNVVSVVKVKQDTLLVKLAAVRRSEFPSSCVVHVEEDGSAPTKQAKQQVNQRLQLEAFTVSQLGRSVVC